MAKTSGRAMSSVAGLRLVVAELLLQQQRRDDEAAHVGEVRAELGEHREREVAPPQVAERQQRVRRPPLDGDEGDEQHGGEDEAGEDGGMRPAPQRAPVDGEQQRRRADAEGDGAGDVERRRLVVLAAPASAPAGSPRPAASVTSVSGTWATKIQRQPNASTIGPPTTTPTTGPPAATIDQ